MFWWAVFLIGGLGGFLLIGALLNRVWGRGSMEGMSENMELEAIRTLFGRSSGIT